MTNLQHPTEEHKVSEQFTRIRYDLPREQVARITLARPEKRNAQDTAMLYEIDRAFTLAGTDPEVKVVVLAADGPDFSSGHDLSGDLTGDSAEAFPGGPIVHQDTQAGLPGIEGTVAFECDAYLGLSLRWRNFPKPTVAQVQGRTIAGGLMLLWPCDIIIAASTASFCDPVVALGVNGHEFFVHPWEVGARKAKEMLFTGDLISAAEAHSLGMVNHVVGEDELEAFTLDLASRIATRPAFALKLAKMSVNQALDAQGQTEAVHSAYSLHALGHANNLQRYGILIDPEGPAALRAGVQGGVR
jgi:enoyl-CoA hydratase